VKQWEKKEKQSGMLLSVLVSKGRYQKFTLLLEQVREEKN